MSDAADDSDDVIEMEVVSGIEASRLKLLVKKLVPMGACHYCTSSLGPSQLYCDNECADFHAHDVKRRKELGL